MEKITAKQALTPEGWHNNVEIGIEGGRISYLRAAPAGARPQLSLLLPAPVNLHSHAFQRAMSGLTEARGPDKRDSFWTWRDLMYRFLGRLTPDQVQAIATHVFMEMLEAGYGSVAEFHYLHHDQNGQPFDNISEMSDRIAAAAQVSGIGLTLLPVLYQHGGCDGRPLAGGQLRFGNDPDRFQRLHDSAARTLAAGPEDFSIGVAPHSLRAVDSAGLACALKLCGDGPVHMHLAEQTAEVEEIRVHTGARPVDWLLHNHDVDARWCLIHCTQMTDRETRALAASGAVAGLCPITESNLGDGIFNGTTYLEAHGRIGVGSDSNVHIALFEELRTLEYSQRLRDRSRAALALPDRSTGRHLFEATALGGAQAGGRECGTLAPGQRADIIGLDLDNERGLGRQGDRALDTLIFGGQGQSCIHEVWSAGRHVVKAGRHIARERITRDFIKVMKELEQQV